MKDDVLKTHGASLVGVVGFPTLMKGGCFLTISIAPKYFYHYLDIAIGGTVASTAVITLVIVIFVLFDETISNLCRKNPCWHRAQKREDHDASISAITLFFMFTLFMIILGLWLNKSVTIVLPSCIILKL